MREIKEISYSMREALTIAIENCDNKGEIDDAIIMLKSPYCEDNISAQETRFKQISAFIKRNVYSAKYCFHCQRWFFEDDYKEQGIYDEEQQSCIFCILDGSVSDSGVDFDF